MRVAWAEDGEKKTSGMTVDDIKKTLGLSIYLQGGYTYNFENPDSQENDLRIFDHKANSFTLDLAQIVFTKDAPVGGVGYKLKLSAGETAKFIHASGLGKSDDAFDLTEAYINYVAPIGQGSQVPVWEVRHHAWGRGDRGERRHELFAGSAVQLCDTIYPYGTDGGLSLQRRGERECLCCQRMG